MKIINLDKNKAKYLVAFCVKEGNTYRFEKIVHVKPNTKLIKYDKDNVFVVDIENPTYRVKNNQYFCIDINAKQVHMKQTKENQEIKNGNVSIEQLQQHEFISSRITKMIFLDNIIEQLAKSVTKPIKQTYDYRALIFGLIIGALIGFIVKIFIPI